MKFTENKDLCVLGIETSCDETSVSLVLGGRVVLSNIIASQIKDHEKFGGVVPEIASRKHIENISLVVEEALVKASKSFADIDVVAVTYAPGLVGALLVGLNYAKGLCFALKKPLVAVHHIEGHICANYIEHKELKPPFVSLIVSGGHTHLAYVKDYGEYEILGRTRDDAAGEAFDKVARSLGLGYPGGPKVEALAKEGNPEAINFPRAKFGEHCLDFSFSGLKSAVLNYLNKAEMKGENIKEADVAASFQRAVTDVLTTNSVNACKLKGMDKLVLAGGVACNGALRQAISQSCAENNIKLYMPSPILCTDNAAMIASAGYYEFLKGNLAPLSLNAYANLELGSSKIFNS